MYTEYPNYISGYSSPFSQSTDRGYLFPNSCRNSQIPYGIVAHEQFSLLISYANLWRHITNSTSHSFPPIDVEKGSLLTHNYYPHLPLFSDVEFVSMWR